MIRARAPFALLACVLLCAACDGDPLTAGDNGGGGGAGTSCGGTTTCASDDAGRSLFCCAGHCAELQGDKDNCGACGHVCPALANTTSVACVAGACAIGACVKGFGDCDGNPENGCEHALGADSNNCGACGNVCQPGAGQSTMCLMGVCTLNCGAGRADCDHLPADGCEVNLLTDLQNCGSCGTTCPVAPHDTALCANGTCANGPCVTGYGDCDKDPKNGCETNLETDAMNCGGCGVACPVINTTSACNNGECAVLSCAPGFADCDGNPNNGCEVNLATDPSNCGQCGLVCPMNKFTCGEGICGGFYGPSGVQNNVSISDLNGWTQCYVDNYGDVSPSISQLLAMCPEAKLMMGCRPTGATTLQVLAWAPRADVVFEEGITNTTHVANGVGWYFDGNYSWGFAPGADTVARMACDKIDSNIQDGPVGPDGDQRLCWHTSQGALQGGWRCGKNSNLNDSTTYERLLFTAPKTFP